MRLGSRDCHEQQAVELGQHGGIIDAALILLAHGPAGEDGGNGKLGRRVPRGRRSGEAPHSGR